MQERTLLIPLTRFVGRKLLRQYLESKRSAREAEALTQTGISFLRWRGPAQRPAEGRS